MFRANAERAQCLVGSLLVTGVSCRANSSVESKLKVIVRTEITTPGPFVFISFGLNDSNLVWFQ